METLYLNLSDRCNSRCLFCAADVAYAKKPQSIAIEDLPRLVGDKRYDSIELSGGEPTIHPAILEIVRYCRARSEHVVLLTHGRGLQDMGFAEKLIEAGVTFFVIPLYGPDAAGHDHVSQVKGSFEQTVRGFENLQALRETHRPCVELKLLLTKYTAPLNSAIYRIALERFPRAMDQISICPYIYSQSALDVREEFSSSFGELKGELFSLMEEIDSDGYLWLRANEFPPCFFPSKKLRALAHPRLNVPQRSHPHFYASRDTAGKVSADNNPAFRSNIRGNVNVQSCQKCIHKDYCKILGTPYFSSSYLERFGEGEFHPISGRAKSFAHRLNLLFHDRL